MSEMKRLVTVTKIQQIKRKIHNSMLCNFSHFILVSLVYTYINGPVHSYTVMTVSQLFYQIVAVKIKLSLSYWWQVHSSVDLSSKYCYHYQCRGLPLQATTGRHHPKFLPFFQGPYQLAVQVNR